MIYDCIIVGTGGAGLSCAIEAKNAGANILVITKTISTASGTSQAQGGINGCLGINNDTVEQHISDTIKSSHGIGDDENINILCSKAKDTIMWLDKLAVPFSRDKDGNIAQRKLGGAKNPRACYSSDYTGLKILHTLYDTCLKLDIPIVEDYMVVDLIVEKNEIKGLIVLDIKTTKVKQILAKKVVMASGGYAGVYTNYNTNSYSSTGDCVSIAINNGCEVSNMEYVQFHPTALKNSGILISESARGEGGYLVTKDEKRFVDELKPRDEVAREIYKKILDNQDVFLDLRHLGEEKIKEFMPQEYNLALQYENLKMDEDLIPIKPVAHYTMGGIKADKYGKTSVKNMYAIGECANNGVHGANRLGGNSLLEIILFGRVTGEDIVNNSDEIKIEEKVYDKFEFVQKDIDNLFKKESKGNFYEIKESLGKLLYENVGLFRNESDLNFAYDKLEKWMEDFSQMGIDDKSKVFNTNLKEYFELKNMLNLSRAIIKSALNRKESRGAHYRVDYIKEDDNYKVESIVTKNDEKIYVEFR
jgi:succinate dehydrogenase/fumarate reductase flavoprotein subunit